MILKHSVFRQISEPSAICKDEKRRNDKEIQVNALSLIRKELLALNFINIKRVF